MSIGQKDTQEELKQFGCVQMRNRKMCMFYACPHECQILCGLTLQTVSIQQILALFVAFDTAL